MALGDKVKHKQASIKPKYSGVSANDRPLDAPTKAVEVAAEPPAPEKLVFSPVDGEPSRRLQVDVPESVFNAFEEWVADEKRQARTKRKKTSKNELATSILEKSLIARGYYKRRPES